MDDKKSLIHKIFHGVREKTSHAAREWVEDGADMIVEISKTTCWGWMRGICGVMFLMLFLFLILKYEDTASGCLAFCVLGVPLSLICSWIVCKIAQYFSKHLKQCLMLMGIVVLILLSILLVKMIIFA